MKTKYSVGIIGLTVLFLLAVQVWAADWKSFASSRGGDMYYDKDSVKTANKNMISVLTKKTYSEQGKLEKYSSLKKLGKAPINPYILSHELTEYEIDCTNQRIKVSSNQICDKRGNVAVQAPRFHGGWNDISRKSNEEKLKNIVCSADKTSSGGK